MFLCFSALLLLWSGYKFYGTKLERLLGADIHNIPTDYEQSKNEKFRFLNFRQAQLAQMGILATVQLFFGAILGIFYGPVLIVWIVVGSIFLGATLNYFAGSYAIRHNGQTLLMSIKQKFPKLYWSLWGFLLLGIVSGISCACSFIFHINYIAQGFSPVIYLYFAAILFMGLCARRYFNLCAIIIGTTFLLATIYFVLVSLNVFPNVMISFDMAVYPQFRYVYPLLFFVVSFGVLSGTGILSGALLAPSLKNEKMAKGVYFGTSVLLAALMIMWIIVFLAHNPDVTLLAKQLYKFNHPYEFIDKVFLVHFNWLGYCIFYIAAIAMSIGGGGILLRLARQLIEETGLIAKNKDRLLTIIIFILGYIAYVFSLGFKAFDIVNMFIAALCLLAFIIFMRQKDKVAILYDLAFCFILGLCLAQLLFVFAHLTIQTASLCGIGLTTAMCLVWCGYQRWYKK